MQHNAVKQCVGFLFALPEDVVTLNVTQMALAVMHHSVIHLHARGIKKHFNKCHLEMQQEQGEKWT
jgi:hypothetical protein